MIELGNNLFVGNQSSFPTPDFSVVNAAKNPWHVDAVGYKGKLDQSHPNYLIHQAPKCLTLNMIDPPVELLPKFTDPMIKAAMDFIENEIKMAPVLVRCNQGLSRSPSIAMIFLARRGSISNQSYLDARADFHSMYPAYVPGAGIEAYLKNGWARILNL